MALINSRDASDHNAAASGAAWLRATMLKDGGFAHFNDFMPEPFVGERLSEVHAEALMALARDCPAGD